LVRAIIFMIIFVDGSSVDLFAYCRTSDADQAAYHGCVFAKEFGITRYTRRDQRKDPPQKIQNRPAIDILYLKLQTTVYMSCGRCGKPILAQQVGSMCANCKSPAARCSIWFVHLYPSQIHHFFKNKNKTHVPPPSHLPVKSMLFHCTVCSHGGHQACYRRFYAEMPLVVLPTPHPPSPASPLIKQPVPPPPDRSASRSKDRGGDDVADIALDHSFDASTIVPPTPRTLMGHSCAAGCGHICWVANFRDDAEKV
jgi:WD repeat-containing protein 24